MTEPRPTEAIRARRDLGIAGIYASWLIDQGDPASVSNGEMIKRILARVAELEQDNERLRGLLPINWQPQYVVDEAVARAERAEAEGVRLNNVIEHMRGEYLRETAQLIETKQRAEAERDDAFGKGVEQIRRRCEAAEAERDALRAECTVARQLGAAWSDYVHGAHYPEASAYEDGIRRCGERLIDDMDEARDAALVVSPSEPQETTP